MTAVDKDVVKLLALFSTTRGEDSSGVAVVGNTDDDPDIRKCVGGPWNLFDTVWWDRLSLFSKRAVLGHARKATVGGISKRTAHPFQYGHLTGVHNGTLRNWRALPGMSEDTDSMTLYEVASRLGMRDAIEQTDGAYALVWWDHNERILNFLRNNERTLYYAFSEDGKRMFWASEIWMLSIALSKSHVKLMNLTPKDEHPTHFLPVEEDTHFKVRLGVGANAIKFLGEEEGGLNELKGGTRKATFQSSTTYSGSRGGGGPYRSPFAWEEENKGKDVTVVRPQGQQGTTKTADASTNTQQGGSTAQSSSSASTASHSPRPLLTLVQDNKSAGSEQSQTSDESLNDKIDVIITPAGDYDKEDYEVTDQKCAFCDVDISFEEAQHGAIGKWLDETTMLCKTCLPYCE